MMEDLDYSRVWTLGADETSLNVILILDACQNPDSFLISPRLPSSIFSDKSDDQSNLLYSWRYFGSFIYGVV
ncbi:hypothetical protein WDU94_013008 [Cyamophila willieti]